MSKRYTYALPDHDVEHGVSIPVEQLLIEPQAQRALSETRAQAMSATFVPSALGTLIVSRRDDSNYVVDGQHRLRAARLAGYPAVMCEVHHGLSVADEASLFLITNRESTKPTAVDEYRIGLTAGLPLFVDTQAVLDIFRLTLGGTATANNIGAVAGTLAAVERYGPDVLTRVLAICETAWGRTANGDCWDGMLIGGLAMLIGRHGDQIDDASLAKKAGKKMPAFRWKGEIITAASAYGTKHTGTGNRVSTAYAMFLHLYNAGRSERNRIVE